MGLPASIVHSTEPPSDAGLVARVRARDPDALSAVYHRHAAAMLTLAARLLGSASEAEDVVQDLFVGLPEALGHYRESGQFPAWLRRILVRLVLMRLRAERRRREADFHEASTLSAFPAGCSGDQADLALALMQLPEDQRVVVVLKAIEGYSHDEIAELLGIRRNSSEVRFHRALQRLRQVLEASC